MSQSNSFDKDFNKWYEEDVVVHENTPEFNPKSGKITGFKQDVTTHKQKTMYFDAPKQEIICKDHKYKLIDPGKYIFKCTKCTYHKIAHPITYKYDPETMKLILRNK